jgi:hypothetical protein
MALQGLVGFGMGQSKYIATVSLYDLSLSTTQPIFRTSIEANSGSSPGLGLIGSAATTGLRHDISRVARETRNYLVDHLK